MVERLGEAADDGQAQAKSRLARRVAVLALEFLEDRLAPVFGNAGSRVADLHQHMVAAPPRPDQHAAVRGIAQGVGEQVLQDAAEHQRVGTHHAARGENAQLQSALLGEIGEVARQRLHHVIELESVDVRLHHAGVEF